MRPEDLKGVAAAITDAMIDAVTAELLKWVAYETGYDPAIPECTVREKAVDLLIAAFMAETKSPGT